MLFSSAGMALTSAGQDTSQLSNGVSDLSSTGLPSTAGGVSAAGFAVAVSLAGAGWSALQEVAARAQAAARIGTAGPMLGLLALLVLLCALAAYRVARNPSAGAGRLVETMAGVWTVLMYLGLGAAPMLYRWWW